MQWKPFYTLNPFNFYYDIAFNYKPSYTYVCILFFFVPHICCTVQFLLPLLVLLTLNILKFTKHTLYEETMEEIKKKLLCSIKSPSNIKCSEVENEIQRHKNFFFLNSPFIIISESVSIIFASFMYPSMF